jgi:hypothetical protein
LSIAAVSRGRAAHADPVLSRDINTYVLFAYDELIWKGGHGSTGYINGSNIGVNYPGMGITMSFGTSGQGVMSPGSQAAADIVRSDDPADVFDTLFANGVNPSFGATVNNPNPATTHGNWPYAGPIIATGDLPVFPFTPNRASTNGASDLTLGAGTHSVLPGVLRDVRFNDNAVINLGAGTYDMRNLSIGKNVTVNLTDNTILQIDRRFDPNEDLQFGTNAGHNGLGKIFVGGFGANPSTTPAVQFSHDAEIHMQLFAPTAWLNIGGTMSCTAVFGHCASPATQTTTCTWSCRSRRLLH